jgi:pyruvate kinase
VTGRTLDPVTLSPMTRHTKIIATLGPSVATREGVRTLVEAGMDVARLNFSHGTPSELSDLYGWVREASEDVGRQVAVMQDIQGPKLRVGSLPDGHIVLEADELVHLIPSQGGPGGQGIIPIGYERLLEDVHPGHKVLLCDGMVELTVEEVGESSLKARVVVPGVVSDNKGVSVPDSRLSMSNVTPKDEVDLEMGRDLGVDFVAASFVRTREDVEEVKSRAGGAPIISKIELARALENLDEIMDASYGVMIARGDLGVQVPLEELPLIQADILSRANALGRITVTATEMLESMTHSPRPTRAEVTDVATAVMGGTDAVMLSGETAIGRYPAQTIGAMSRICHKVEEGTLSSRGFHPVEFVYDSNQVASAVAQAATQIALNVGAGMIVAFTESGTTARLISKYRPEQRVVAFTHDPSTLRRMALLWGVTPKSFERQTSTDEEMSIASSILEEDGLVSTGDTVVMVAGVPPNVSASTNLVKVHRVGEATGHLGG